MRPGLPRIFRRGSYIRTRYQGAKMIPVARWQWCVVRGSGPTSEKIEKVTNEPVKSLKTFTFHFWNSPEAVNLFKTSMIQSLCRQVAGNKKVTCRARGENCLVSTKRARLWGLSGIPDGLEPAKMKNITNEPSILLKIIIFHFLNSGEPSILLKRLEIRPLTQHIAETKYDTPRCEPLKDSEFDRMSETSHDMAANPACC